MDRARDISAITLFVEGVGDAKAFYLKVFGLPVVTGHIWKTAHESLGGTLVRAVVYDRYGSPDVLHVESVEPPVPKDDEVLIRIPPPRHTRRDVVFIKELIEAGRYRAVVDRSDPLEDVREAVRYVETEHKTGNVVLTIPPV